MGPRDVDVITHRELAILMKAETESAFDNYEDMSMAALMNRQAYHAKKLKATDLFKRPVDDVEAKNRQKDKIQQQRHAEEWLAQFEIVLEDKDD